MAPKLVDLAMREFGFTFSEIFECYLPVKLDDQSLERPEDLDIEFVENEQVTKLYQHPGFQNALTYNPELTGMAMVAYDRGTPCAIAGANPNSPELWGIGVDVLPEYRNRGIATYLVHSLTKKVLGRDTLPVYPTWYSNIHSQNTALSVGYRPVWVEIECEALQT